MPRPDKTRFQLINLFRNTQKGHILRIGIIGLILISVMLFSIFNPTLTGYAESLNAKTDDTALKVEPSGFSNESFNDDENKNNKDILETVDSGVNPLRHPLKWNQNYNSDAYVLSEDTESRTAKEKHFLMSDGSYNLISYAEDIHYLDEDGKFKEIDNTLEK
ncbi:MAG: hypothetical protein LBU04_01280, partial [Christensenellaceae bacterium]|nr:hypothetical protein [Christensenellaceae bacterium]